MSKYHPKFDFDTSSSGFSSRTTESSSIPNGTSNRTNLDPYILRLVKDFFNSQFELKHTQCPFPNISTINGNDPTANSSPNNNILTTSNGFNRVRIALRSLGRSFQQEFEKKLFDIITKLDLEESPSYEHLCATFHCLSNEMFIHGIEWNRIITYFVFSSDFAYYSMNNRSIKSPSSSIVLDVAKWLTKYIMDHLLPWIEKNDGWEGLVNFGIEPTGSSSSSSSHEDSLFKNLDLKNIICGAAGALGVLSLGFFLSSK